MPLPLQRPAPPPGRSPNHRPFYEGIDTEQVQNNIRERVILKPALVTFVSASWMLLSSTTEPFVITNQLAPTHARSTHALTQPTTDRERGETEADGCTCSCCKVTENRCNHCLSPTTTVDGCTCIPVTWTCAPCGLTPPSITQMHTRMHTLACLPSTLSNT